jgi:hypothetical protein
MSGMPTTNSEQGWFADPWPLAEDLAICGYDYSPNQYQVSGFGLYLVDGSGNQELIFRDPDYSSHHPVPFRPRTRPPVLPRTCDPPPAQSPPTSPIGYRNQVGDGVLLLSDVSAGWKRPLPDAGGRPAVPASQRNAGPAVFHRCRPDRVPARRQRRRELDPQADRRRRPPASPTAAPISPCPPIARCTSSCSTATGAKSGGCGPGSA